MRSSSEESPLAVTTQRLFRFTNLILILLLVITNYPARAADPGFDHSAFDQILQATVVAGRVNYQAMKQHTGKLDGYLATLAVANLNGTSRSEKLAFYINAYNAATLRLILRHYGRITSIRDIEKKFGYHQWKKEEWRIAGELLSLDNIEHEKLRKELKEPRIHFAIVCASIGCPLLYSRAFTGKNIEAELDTAARRFNSSPLQVKVKVVNGWLSRTPTLKVSRIYSWFKGDFGKDLPGYIAKYSSPSTAKFIKKHRASLSLSFLDYDWSLNDTDKLPEPKAP